MTTKSLFSKILVFVILGPGLSTSVSAAISENAPLTLSQYLQAGSSVSQRAQSQLTVSPSTDLTVRALTVTCRGSSDGSCSGFFNGTCTLDNGVGNTVVLSSLSSYVSTDSSNWGLYLHNDGCFNPISDCVYQFKDNSLANVGSSQCVQGGGGNVCNNSSDCGWTSPRSWTP